ncbi:MAG: heavy-metal-associated domain-containing protein, partial [Prevotella sp.]|nr:heavy-metal-associated domain-containing protein [Prevotella sp.]
DEVILRKVSLHIDDMHCDKCTHKILTALDSVEGIDSMAPHVAEHNFLICYDANRTTKGDIRKAVTRAGYTPVAHYASEKAAYAYFVIPKEKATSETTDAALTIEGVNDANVNARRGALAITYISSKTSVQQLLEALKREGIDAAVPPAHKCKEKESGRKE